MALPDEVILGSDVVLMAGAGPTVIGGGVSDRLIWRRDLINTFNKSNTGWRTQKATVSRVSVQSELEFLDGGVPITGIPAQLTLEGDILLEVRRFVMTIAIEFAERVTQTSGYVRGLKPYARSIETAFEALWIDPLNDGIINPGVDASALLRAIDYVNADASVDLTSVLTFGATQSYTYEGQAGELDAIFPVDDFAQVTGMIKSNGAVTPVTTGMDAGLKAFLDDLLVADVSNMTGLTTYIRNQAAAFEGSGHGFPSQVVITMEANGIVSVSFNAEVNGVFTTGATA